MRTIEIPDEEYKDLEKLKELMEKRNAISEDLGYDGIYSTGSMAEVINQAVWCQMDELKRDMSDLDQEDQEDEEESKIDFSKINTDPIYHGISDEIKKHMDLALGIVDEEEEEQVQ